MPLTCLSIRATTHRQACKNDNPNARFRPIKVDKKPELEGKRCCAGHQCMGWGGWCDIEQEDAKAAEERAAKEAEKEAAKAVEKAAKEAAAAAASTASMPIGIPTAVNITTTATTATSTAAIDSGGVTSAAANTVPIQQPTQQEFLNSRFIGFRAMVVGCDPALFG